MVRLPGPTVVVSDLAEMMEVRPAEVLKHLMLDLGIMATITQSIDSDTARQVAYNFEVEVRGRRRFQGRGCRMTMMQGCFGCGSGR